MMAKKGGIDAMGAGMEEVSAEGGDVMAKHPPESWKTLQSVRKAADPRTPSLSARGAVLGADRFGLPHGVWTVEEMKGASSTWRQRRWRFGFSHPRGTTDHNRRGTGAKVAAANSRPRHPGFVERFKTQPVKK